LPIGFMGGIIGKFFHEFGLTIVAAVLISMFVSFTLDPMLSSVWEDPSIAAHGKASAQRSLYDRTIGRITGWFDTATERMAEVYQDILRWSLAHKLATLALALLVFVTSILMIPLLGTEFVPKADYSEMSINFYTPVGSSLEATEARTRQVEAVIRDFPEVRYTLSTINTGNAQGKMYASVYVRLVDRKARQRNVDQMAVVLRQRLASIAGVTVTHAGLLDPVGGNKPVTFSILGTDTAELERLSALAQEKFAASPAWSTWTPASSPTSPRWRCGCAATRRPTWGWGWAPSAMPCAPWWRGVPWATGGHRTTRPMTSMCGWHPKPAATPTTWPCYRLPSATPTARPGWYG